MSRREWKSEIRTTAEIFLVIFLVTAIAVTVSTLLLLHNANADRAQLLRYATPTFFNVLFLTFLYTAVYMLWRYFTVVKPARKIQSALSRMTSGDFEVKLDLNETYGNLLPIAADVNVAAEELKSVETLKTDFLSNVTHELKTPLAGMKSYAQLLRAPGLSEEERMEYAESMIQSLTRMDGLITDILRLNKLENQKLTPKCERFDLSAALTECILLFEPIWEDKDITLEIEIPDNVFVVADRELLDLIWNNLLSNAFKFTPNGGTVGVSLTKKSDTICVSISDTGPGISAETGRHIFDKFYQGDPSHATKGNGLGLALVKRVLDLTGSEITVHSKVGKGSTFTVLLREAKGDAAHGTGKQSV